MIRTHRPRGYAWNCASVFQQTLDFRHIDLHECEPPEEDVLCADPHDEWSLAERHAKRQRIAKLADDFLNGTQLHIQSARPDPQRFRSTLALSFARPRDARAAVEEAEIPRGSTAAWEDVDDDRDILRAAVSARRGTAEHESTTVLGDHTAAPIERTIITEVQAQASCGPKRNLRSRTVLAGPSEEALRKAAELRDRRLRRSVLEASLDSQPQSCPRPVVPETQAQSVDSSLCDTASDCGPSPTPAWTSSKWIKSGAFQLRKKGVDEDCSKDELGASSMFTPSQRSRTRRPLARTASATNASSRTGLDAAPISSVTSNVTDSLARRQSITQSGHESFHSAVRMPETSNPSQATPPRQHLVSEGLGDEVTAQDDSQSRLLHRQGLRVGPRGSWAAVNNGPTDDAARPEDDRCDKSMPAQHYVHLAHNTSKGRKARSTGAAKATEDRLRASPRRRSAPLRSQNQAGNTTEGTIDQGLEVPRSRTDYTEVAVSGASPFVFRKRTSKSNAIDTPQAALTTVPKGLPSKTPRRQMVFPSSDSPHQLASVPHTPLADEHLNKILPRDPTSGRRSSTTRRALREELRASGAEISRCAGDPSSSQGEASAGDSTYDGDSRDDQQRGQPEHVESQPPWPGTQDQLAAAYKNLFTSPDKTDTALYLGEKSTPGGNTEASRTGRNPLRQLSQEPMPMPSTQALLDGWEGWSTIKKPRPAGKRSSLIQSPTVGKGEMMISSDPAQSIGLANRRRSSLRFSMSTADSPEKPQSKDNSLPAPKLAPPQLEKDSSGFLKPAPRRSSGGAPSSLSFGFSTLDLPTNAGDQGRTESLSTTLDDISFGPTMSTYQQAQRQPDLDSQELDLTITQIADDVLTSGVERIMSQTQGNSF